MPEPTREAWSPPRRLEAGAWVNADRGLAREALESAWTVVARWRAGSLAGVAAMRAAEATARAAGARTLGLHVPGHSREREPATVRAAVLREGIHAPVRLDPDGRLAEALGLAATPGVAVLDGDARVAWREEGVPGPATRRALEDASGEAAAWPVRGDALGPETLAYPGGLAADGGRLAVADTAHHRVLVRGSDGATLALGRGAPGDADGVLSRARLSRPRGLAWTAGGLLVADPGAGALRRVDLDSERVGTVLGGPDLAGETDAATGGVGPAPFDVAPAPGGDTVGVALAGEGALALVDPGEGRVVERVTPEGLVEPRGLARLGGAWVLADPGAGALWRLDDEGALDALADDERLSHPVAVAADGEAVLVADAYADAVLRVGPEGTVARVGGRVPAPRAVAVGAEGPLAAGAHQVRRLGEDSGPLEVPAPTVAADHVTALDPVEAAPGGTLALELVARGAGEADVEPGAPDLRGPAVPLAVDEGERRGEALWASVQARVEAAGEAVLAWPLTVDGEERRAAWRLPVIARPGADEQAAVRLSTTVSRGQGLCP